MRDLITTVFEVLGLLCIIVGVALAAGQIAVPLGFIVGGGLLFGSSMIIVKAGRR